MTPIMPNIRSMTFQEAKSAGLHPREVFKTACLSNAAAVILVHQHPTGDSSPSSEDLSITRRLKEAGEIMGIKVLDHIIIGDSEYLSFVERGLL
jgi:DNA repair protein RadC